MHSTRHRTHYIAKRHKPQSNSLHPPNNTLAPHPNTRSISTQVTRRRAYIRKVVKQTQGQKCYFATTAPPTLINPNANQAPVQKYSFGILPTTPFQGAPDPSRPIPFPQVGKFPTQQPYKPSQFINSDEWGSSQPVLDAVIKSKLQERQDHSEMVLAQLASPNDFSAPKPLQTRLKSHLTLNQSESENIFQLDQHQQIQSNATTTQSPPLAIHTKKSQPLLNPQTNLPDPRLDDEDDDILRRSTVDFVYPDYYISSRNNLWPTTPYVIDPVIETLLSQSLPNVPRVGSNPEAYDDTRLFEIMAKDLKQRDVWISDKISVSDFDLGSNQPRSYSKTPAERIRDQFEQKQQNWGLLATGDIRQGERVLVIPTTAFITGIAGIQSNPHLPSLIRNNIIPSYLDDSNLMDIDFMINACRLVLGTSEIGQNHTKPFLHTASFAFGLLGNRLIGPASTLHPIIQALPSSYPTTHVMNHVGSLYSMVTSPRGTGVSDTIGSIWKLLESTSCADLLHIYASHIKTAPDLLPANRNMVLRMREAAGESILDMFTRVAIPFDKTMTNDTLQSLFQWSFLTTLTRSMSIDFGIQTEIDDKINGLLMTNPKLALAPPADYLNQSQDPNCEVKFPTSEEQIAFDKKLRFHYETNNGQLDPLYIKELNREAPALVIMAARDIEEGEQLTIPYNHLKDLDITPITPWNEPQIESTLTSTYDLTELFTQSLSRVPAAMHHQRKSGKFGKSDKHEAMFQYQEEPNQNNPAIYGFYPPFHINDNMILFRPSATHGRKVLPCYDYLATGFKTKVPMETITEPRNLQNYYDMSHADTIYSNNAYYPSLSWPDAPIKYILPMLFGGFDHRLHHHQRYKEIMDGVNALVHTTSTGQQAPLMTLFKSGWLGPSHELESMMRLTAAGGFYAPDPVQFHHDRLGFDNNNNNNKEDRFANAMKQFPFSPQESLQFILKRMTTRLDQVLDKVEKRIRDKYGLGGNAVTKLTPQQWLEGFGEPVDEENEYGKLIQYLFTLQQYQDYSTSPISLVEEEQEVEKKKDEGFDWKVGVDGGGQSPAKPTPAVSKPVTSAPISNIKLPKTQSNIPALKTDRVKEPHELWTFEDFQIKSQHPDLVHQSIPMVQSRQEIDQAVEHHERMDKVREMKEGNGWNNQSPNKSALASLSQSTSSSSAVALPSPFLKETALTTTSQSLPPARAAFNPNLDPTKNPDLAPPMSIKRVVAGYYHSILQQNFDLAMSALHQYHHLTLISHSVKVMSTRLGLVEWGQRQGINQVGDGNMDEGEGVQMNQQIKGEDDLHTPVLTPFWHANDGIIPLEHMNVLTKVHSIPHVGNVNGRVELD